MFVYYDVIIFRDASQTSSSERSFWFEMSPLTDHLKKMIDASPNLKFYNLSILEYEVILYLATLVRTLLLRWKFRFSHNLDFLSFRFNCQARGNAMKPPQISQSIIGK